LSSPDAAPQESICYAEREAMRPARNRFGSLARTAAALALVPMVALAQGSPGTTKPRNDAGSGKYNEVCAQGNARYAAQDFQGAIGLYNRAIQIDPKNALGHYLLGEAQLAAGNVGGAEAEWNEASLDSSEKDPGLRARILFVTADLKERQWKWDEAKGAWQVYVDWANRYPAAGAFPASGRSRQQRIDLMLKQERAYEIVRHRIAETNDGGVFTDLSKPGSDAAK
jgi:tetratricopeptide (TPR) repeat protein